MQEKDRANDIGRARDERAGGRRDGRIAVAGRNCWQIVRAGRLAFLVDAAAYFRALKRAALRARRSILIIGWDVHSGTPLEFPEDASPDVPNELGPFLDHLAKRRKELQIRVLVWDSPLFYRVDRELLPQASFDWFAHERLCLALDDQHPLGASQHQKLVVIDDRIAFVGGIDLTLGRLDTSEHRPGDPRRLGPDGESYEPFHDAQIAVDGAAAGALADVARDRWLRATGQRLDAIETSDDPWPDELAPDVEDVDVAIARTYPAWKGRAQVREVEALYLDAISRARATIYIETQYLTATRVAQAVLEGLKQADGPEIVLLLPREPTGWLEQAVMGTKQQSWLTRLRAADRHGRFRAYMPVVGDHGEDAVNLHAKIMVVDGRFLRIGSANLNNRSMGLDAECDIAIECEPGSTTARSITALRDRLLAEHLATSDDRVAAAIESSGSLIAAIEQLRGDGRSLVPFPEGSPEPIEAVVAKTELLDPSAPLEPEQIAERLAESESERTSMRVGFLRVAAIILVLAGFAALWRWGPLSGLVDAARIEAWVESLRGEWTAVAAVLGAYVVGGLVGFPVVVLIAVTGVLYGPVTGLLVAGAGSLLSASLGYAAGVLLGRDALRRLAGGRLDRVSRYLAHRGLVSMTIIRLLPLAPFALVNIAAGASHIGFRDFFLGTALGMAPGIAAITLFSGQLGEVVRTPDAVNVAILLALLLAIGAAMTWAWRRFLHGRADAGSA